MIILTISLSAFFIACTSSNDENDSGKIVSEERIAERMEGNDNLQSEVSSLMKSYMEISEAMVADDSKAAKNAAEEMMKDPDINEAMKNQLANIAGLTDLEEQRKLFSDLSLEMYQVAKVECIPQTVYWFHCPMAIDNQGANWLSTSKEVSNPYMGQKMPSCGIVKEEL